MKKGPIKRLYDFTRPYKKKYALALVFSIVYTLARASQPLIIGMAISELARNVADWKLSGFSGVNFIYMRKVMVWLLITSGVDAMGDYISNYLLSDAVQDTTLDMRKAIYDKINSLPISYFDSQPQGEILSRVTTDVTVVSDAMQQTLLKVLSSILSLVFGIGFMIYLSPFFTLVTLLMYPICFWLFKKLLGLTQPNFRDLQDSLGDLNSYTQEYYSAFNVIQLFGQEEKVIEDFKGVNDRLSQVGLKANFQSSTINPILSFITHLFYIGLFLVLAITSLDKPLVVGGFVLAAQMEIGAIQAFIQYIWQASVPISQISQLSNLFQTAGASLTRVFEILDEEEEDFIEENLDLDKLDIKGAISFDGVEFGYSKDKKLMDGVNIDVKSGDMVAVVGPTGAGKTTLINLLMRFYDIDGGKISIDGVDISKLSKSQSRSLFAIVDQKPWLYSASIAENIRFGRLDAGLEDVVRAAKMASADHFIRTLPDGYNTIIDEESTNVSQGEKQLITIARALLKDPWILILDEATSSVDTRLEYMLQQAMDKAMEDRTSFIIAHRLSTIRDADLILVMENGSITEQGNHEELIKKNGVYKELYESQFL